MKTMKTLCLALVAAALLPTSVRASEGPFDPYAYLGEGNEAWVADGAAMRAPWVSTQKPKVAVLSCADSRVVPEFVFGKTGELSELFVTRIAGNVPMSGMIASLEYGVEHLGVKAVLVLGHTKCGAVKATAGEFVKRSRLSKDLTLLVEEIMPAVREAAAHHPDATVDELAAEAVHVNAKLAAENLVHRSAIIREAAALGHIEVLYGVYDIASGEVEIEGSIAAE